jgi:hypothetical protein
MATYDIVVQGNLYATVTTDDGYNAGEVMSHVYGDIASGNLVVDKTKPVSISIVPVNTV